MDKDAILSKRVKKIKTITVTLILSSIFGFYSAISISQASTSSIAQTGTSKTSLNSQINLPTITDKKTTNIPSMSDPEPWNPAPWKTWRTKDNIMVSYRASEYKDLLEIKAQAKIHSTLSGFIYFIEDLTQVDKWLDNVQSAEIIQQISATENIFITRFKGLWPVSAREMIVHSRFWQNNDLSIEIAVTDAGHMNKATANAIRVHVHRAHWHVIPIKAGEIEITYQFVVDPKGNIPQWLVKSMTLRSMWRTLVNLKKQLPSSPWQQQRKANIQELQ